MAESKNQKLQAHKVQPVGAHEEREIDVRVISATKRDLRREAVEKRFRHDLYYRLHVMPLQMPSLREHPVDTPLLTHHCLELIRQRLGFDFPQEIEEEAINLLCSYRWPGNVRSWNQYLSGWQQLREMVV